MKLSFLLVTVKVAIAVIATVFAVRNDCECVNHINSTVGTQPPNNSSTSTTTTISTSNLYPEELLRIIKIPSDYLSFPTSSAASKMSPMYELRGSIEEIQFLEESQKVNVTIEIHFVWTDPRLRFRKNVSHWEELPPSVFEMLWRPTPYISRNDRLEHFEDPVKKEDVVVHNDGRESCKDCARFRASVRQSFVFWIKMDYTFYPNDRHELVLFLGGGGSSTTSKMSLMALSFGKPKMYSHSTYYITGKSYRLDKIKGNQTFTGNNIDMVFVFNRKLQSHLIRTYVPTGFFAVLGWLSMLLPLELATERVALCTGTLLTITTFFNTASLLGPSVNYLRALDIWLLGSIIFIFLILFENIAVLKVAGIFGKASKAKREEDTYRKLGKALEGILKLHLDQLEHIRTKAQIKVEGDDEDDDMTFPSPPPKSKSLEARDERESELISSGIPNRDNNSFRRGISIAKRVDQFSIAILTFGIIICSGIYWYWILGSPQNSCDRDEDCSDKGHSPS